MKALLCLLVAVFLTSCAGSAVDKDFRRKVKAVDVNGQAEYDPISKAVTGSASAHFELRDPSKD